MKAGHLDYSSRMPTAQCGFTRLSRAGKPTNCQSTVFKFPVGKWLNLGRLLTDPCREEYLSRRSPTSGCEPHSPWRLIGWIPTKENRCRSTSRRLCAKSSQRGERVAIDQALWDKSGGRCHLCEEPLNRAADDIQADHDFPESEGGATDWRISTSRTGPATRRSAMRRPSRSGLTSS